jgi:hypothetical protein
MRWRAVKIEGDGFVGDGHAFGGGEQCGEWSRGIDRELICPKTVTRPIALVRGGFDGK